eukprot:Gb_22168 [translate_table: standard]
MVEVVSSTSVSPSAKCEVPMEKANAGKTLLNIDIAQQISRKNSGKRAFDGVDNSCFIETIGKQTMAEDALTPSEKLLAIPKLKKPKPSAVRDFPPGCGRFASRIGLRHAHDGVSDNPTANLTANDVDGYSSHVENDTPKTTVRTAVPDKVICPLQTGSPYVGNDTPQASVRPPETDMAICPLQTMTPPGENDAPQASVGPAETDMAICPLQSITTCDENDTSQASVRPAESDRAISPFQAIPGSPATLPRKFLSRPVSASRDLPFGCGRNAPPTTREECLKAVGALKVRNSPSGKNTQPSREHRLRGQRSPPGKAVRASSGLKPIRAKSKLSLIPRGSKENKTDVKWEGHRNDQEESRPDEQALIEAPNHQLSQSGPEISQIFKVHGEIADGSDMETERKYGASPGPKYVASPECGGGDAPVGVRSRPKIHVNFALTPFDTTNLRDMSEGDGTVTRSKVRETLRLFQALFRKFLQEEETRRKERGQGSAHKRPDIQASQVLREKNMWVNVGKQIVGHVPGVEVGDEFHYRIELCMVGLHRQSQGGIDYLKQGNTIVATSIVASGGYADDVDNGEVLIYTGQGGNNSSADKRQAEDQKLERGNLSLKNCIDTKSPVRVIRGIKEPKHSTGARGGKESTKNKMGITYTYDGLYHVEKYWQERGTSGFVVFKFQLRRMSGQPELAWNIVKAVGRSKQLAIREGLRIRDISQGKETRPICVVNTIDDESGPAPFEYSTKVLYPSWYNPTPQRGCDCIDGCSESENCLCAVKNGGELPYNYNGAIVEAKPIVYECGPSCKCPPTCHNRVSQHGVKFDLEIFKTDKRGWGVRAFSSIPSGSFICEYTGELLSDTEAEQRTGNDEYLFDIGSYNNDQSLWGGLSDLIPEAQSHANCDTVEDVGYTIDAAKYGSVGRFINHSCSPNLYAQNVLYDHDDKTVPHIMLFAAENIPPLQELSYHYNYNLDHVRDSDGNIKKKSCYCGSAECTGRLY